MAAGREKEEFYSYIGRLRHSPNSIIQGSLGRALEPWPYVKTQYFETLKSPDPHKKLADPRGSTPDPHLDPRSKTLHDSAQKWQEWASDTMET